MAIPNSLVSEKEYDNEPSVLRIRKFLGLPEPDLDPLVRGKGQVPDPDPYVIKQNCKKNLYSYRFVTFYDFFYLWQMMLM